MMYKSKNIFTCKKCPLIFRRDAIWCDQVMSACAKMGEKGAADGIKFVRRSLRLQVRLAEREELVKW